MANRQVHRERERGGGNKRREEDMEKEGEKSFYFKGERKDWKTAKIKSPQTSRE